MNICEGTGNGLVARNRTRGGKKWKRKDLKNYSEHAQNCCKRFQNSNCSHQLSIKTFIDQNQERAGDEQPFSNRPFSGVMIVLSTYPTWL